MALVEEVASFLGGRSEFEVVDVAASGVEHNRVEDGIALRDIAEGEGMDSQQQAVRLVFLLDNCASLSLAHLGIANSSFSAY